MPTAACLRIADLLADGRPRCVREIAGELGIAQKLVEDTVRRGWIRALFLRSERPFRGRFESLQGRRGLAQNTRSFYLYVINEERAGEVGGVTFAPYSRPEGRVNKAKAIMDFLRENKVKAFYTRQIVEALKEYGVKIADVMPNLRRYERKGWVFIRGYRGHDRETMFSAGYAVTWLDPEKDRVEAIREALQRTERLIAGEATGNPIANRIRIIRDEVVSSALQRDMVSHGFLRRKVRATKHQFETALRRAMEIYPEIRCVRIFNFPYYYHETLSEADLRLAVEDKKDYLRKTKGRDNRIGHNWEACVEWFVDKFTKGAEFWEQRHRERMDPRRITLHLVKPIGDRKANAEVDRVWTVRPSPISPAITYVLECKWSLVNKFNLDEFLNVLRWSKEFGVDTRDGRSIKNGVVGIFAAGAFNPKETVTLQGEVMSLASYAGRINIQLLKASELNQMLHERGVDKGITIQKICARARNEAQVREVLTRIWTEPVKAGEMMAELLEKNRDVYEFEEMLSGRTEPSAQESMTEEPLTVKLSSV